MKQENLRRPKPRFRPARDGASIRTSANLLRAGVSSNAILKSNVDDTPREGYREGLFSRFLSWLTEPRDTRSTICTIYVPYSRVPIC